MSGRTPGPWRYFKEANGTRFHVTARATGTPGTSREDFAQVDIRHETDAAFIVAACNAHDELVAALREIEGYSGHYATQKNPSIRAIQDIARAALAKVQS